MKKTVQLQRSDVITLIATAEQEAIKNGWNVSIAVCCQSGLLLGLSRLDNAAPISAKIAEQKAYCSALSGKDSGSYEKTVNEGRFAALSLPVITLQGALPIIIADNVVGAIGVSGVKPEQDEQIAKVAIDIFFTNHNDD